MLKWKILAVLGLAFGLAGIGWGYGQGKKAVGFFELRVYTAQPGKRDALAARFREPHSRHLREARNHERGVLDPTAERPGTGHQRREYVHLHAGLSV